MWKHHIPDWVPLAGLITGKMDSPFFTRIAEMLIVGIVSGFVTLKALENDVANLGKDVLTLKNSSITHVEFDMHKKQNEEYRDRMAKEKEEYDRKWDARITRLENCFILRECKR